MNFPQSLLPHTLYWVGWLIYSLFLVRAVWRAPWRRLRSREQTHIYLGITVLLIVIWMLKAGIHPGLDFHLLGATLLLLMFGWELSYISLTLVMAANAAIGSFDLMSFGLNAVVMAGTPILISYSVFMLSLRYLPHHFFVYVLVNGYLCGGLAMLLTLTTSSIIMLCCSDYTLDFLGNKYLPFIPMMIFAEGFFSGMLVSSMALWRPEWIWSFDDRRYLSGK